MPFSVSKFAMRSGAIAAFWVEVKPRNIWTPSTIRSAPGTPAASAICLARPGQARTRLRRIRFGRSGRRRRRPAGRAALVGVVEVRDLVAAQQERRRRRRRARRRGCRWGIAPHRARPAPSLRFCFDERAIDGQVRRVPPAVGQLRHDPPEVRQPPPHGHAQPGGRRGIAAPRATQRALEPCLRLPEQLRAPLTLSGAVTTRW